MTWVRRAVPLILAALLTACSEPTPDVEAMRAVLDVQLQAAETAFARGDYEAAAASYRSALDGLAPAAEAERGAALVRLDSVAGYPAWLASVHDNVGVALLRLGRYQEAEQAIRRALELDPERALFHANLGTCLWRANRLSEAEQAFAAAAARDADNPRVAVRRGQVLVALGRGDEAVPILTRAIALLPQPDLGGLGIEVWLALGSAYAGSGQSEHAIDAFARVLQLAPGTSEAWYRLSLLLSRTGKQQQADTAKRRVQALADHDRQLKALQALPSPAVDDLRARATLLRSIGRPHAARTQYLKLTRREPEQPCHWLAVAELDSGLGAPEHARRAAREVLALRPGCREAAAILGGGDLANRPGCCSE